MPALVENQYIYIAQPPLYRVTRKKKSRYIHSEREMDDYLLELGTGDVKVVHGKEGSPLPEEDLKAFLSDILDIETVIRSLERKGVPFRGFLQLRNDKGLYPRYMVTVGDEVRYAYDSEEIAAWGEAFEAEQRQGLEEQIGELPVAEQQLQREAFHAKHLPYVELFQPESFDRLLERLKGHGVKLDNYLVPDGVLFDVVADNGEATHTFTLKELIEGLRANGRKGMEIQRYKGLGEMNAEQLWETTMDPKVRTLIQVTLPDTIAADHMFSMLMGEDVAPRRRFIEHHALSVKNLDI